MLRTHVAEEYMHIVTSCLSERHFLVDYTKAYSLRDDLELINQVGVELDPMRVQYLYDGVEGAQNKENGEKITQDLENIIKFVDQLENANTQNIEPLASPLEKTAKTRNDEVTAKNRKETFLERSPKSNDDYFLVPRVVE